MNAFAAGSVYDLAVNKMPGFATISYAELAMQRLPPPTVDPMRDVRRRHPRLQVFIASAKIDGPYIVRSVGDAYVAPSVPRMVRRWKSQ
jgi:hypothetical protein